MRSCCGWSLDKGTTNVRNTARAHWRPWLGPNNRALGRFTAFSEPDWVGGTPQPIWYALGPERPLAFFAGLWTPRTCVRKIKEDEVSCELLGFLTTDPNAEVAAHHSKAMPVILREPVEWDLWLSEAPWPEVAVLQRPHPHDSLTIVARGPRQDEPGFAA